MMTGGVFLIVLVLGLVLVDILALMRAPDSRDGMQSEEQELRRLWRTMR
jgi:hypothetical protein